jgi:exodeoxyribonuclease VII large subunit
MVGQIDVSPDGTCLLISFPYRADLVEVVKTIPGRRWDKGSRTWKVPVTEVERCVKTFLAHGFHLSPDVATALAAGGKGKHLGTMQLGKVDQAPAITVSQLNLRVAEVLHQNLKESVWVIGEIASLKPRGRGRNLYFELVERAEDPDAEEGADAQPRAVVETVIFEQGLSIVNRRLRTSLQPFELADGVKVRVRGKVDLYQPRGRYQFVIEDIDPAYTLGELFVRREKILADLDQLGVRTRNAELPMPLAPLRVALVTSFDSEGYHDFVKTLKGKGFNFDITVYDVFVQGDRLKPTVLAALEAFAGAAVDFDVLCIVRGGGSRSELGGWDDLEVAKAVATHPLKAVIGIGHERDQSVLDLIATSTKTPTAAAELLVERARAYQERVEDAMLTIAARVREIFRHETRALHGKATSLRHLVQAGLAGAEGTLLAARGRIQRGVRVRLQTEGFRLRAAAQRLGKSSRQRVERNIERLAVYEARTHAAHPARVLRRGFAILRDEQGKALRSVQATRAKARLTGQLADGRLGLTVETIHPE